MLDGIKNYLSMDSTGALMVSGEWGCGKTYHIEKVVIPALQQEGWNPVKVSLFGIESINEIPLRIADNYKRPESDEVVKPKMDGKRSRWLSWGKEKAGKAIVKGSQLVSSISWLESFVDVKTLVGNNSGMLYKLIPTEKTVIILDDIERVIDTIDIHTILGAINGLVEQRGYKVVVIANNSYMQQKGDTKLVFKEKVIEKTLVYNPNVVAIFKELCVKDYQSSFIEFMKNPKSVEVIDPSFSSYKENNDLLVELHNIRILKFAMVHFSKIYETCFGFLNDENENKDLVDSFLMSLWACTVGIAIEYKKDRLTYKDRLQFTQFVELSSIDWALDDGIGTMLPTMQSDIMLSYKKGDIDKTLIIDAKYYAHTTQVQYDVHTLHSNNLYQIFTYVKNRAAKGGEVAGMLLYAKTDEEIYPDNEYKMSGNRVTVRTLDLNRDFADIAFQLDAIVQKHFAL